MDAKPTLTVLVMSSRHFYSVGLSFAHSVVITKFKTDSGKKVKSNSLPIKHPPCGVSNHR